MKAWQVHELGEPRDVLALAEVAEPEPRHMSTSGKFAAAPNTRTST